MKLEEKSKKKGWDTRRKNPDQSHEDSACGGPEGGWNPERWARGVAGRTASGDTAGFFHRHARYAGVRPGCIAAQDKDGLVKIPPVGTGYYDNPTGNAFYHNCVRSFCRRFGLLQSVCPDCGDFIPLGPDAAERDSGAAPTGWRRRCGRRGGGFRPSTQR